MVTSAHTNSAASETRVIVVAASDDDRPRAEMLADELGATLLEAGAVDNRAGTLRLVVSADGLALASEEMSLTGDFSHMVPRLRHDRLGRELLVRAAKPKHADASQPLHAVDACAGLGEDALLLAATGYEVTLYERDPIIAALLSDTLARAQSMPELTEAVGRMRLVAADSIEALPRLGTAPDLVFLDPMFPAKAKDARAKKKLQMLQMLEDPCMDEGALVQAALAAHPRRIVVKRPLKGPWLADIKPTSSINGKTVRYDCIMPAGC